MEECAIREVFEEVGVRIENPEYQFSQPWPFPSSLMMGFFARATGREIRIDPAEIEEARWLEKSLIEHALAGRVDAGLQLPPPFTIAHQLLRRWVST